MAGGGAWRGGYAVPAAARVRLARRVGAGQWRGQRPRLDDEDFPGRQQSPFEVDPVQSQGSAGALGEAAECCAFAGAEDRRGCPGGRAVDAKQSVGGKGDLGKSRAEAPVGEGDVLAWRCSQFCFGTGKDDEPLPGGCRRGKAAVITVVGLSGECSADEWFG
jgi:hypothetical protein